MQSSTVSNAAQSEAPSWLVALRRYLVFVVAANLVWEFAHLPLYTIWDTGSRFDLAFAALHCTGGDILIAVTSIVAVLLIVGNSGWPTRGGGRVAALTIGIGVAYTIFSEWLNIEVRAAWAYSDAMPILPMIGTGVSPVLQWVVIPIAAFVWARRGVGMAARPFTPT